jgi:ABC-type amino acid transport substrate-binding protein
MVVQRGFSGAGPRARRTRAAALTVTLLLLFACLFTRPASAQTTAREVRVAVRVLEPFVMKAEGGGFTGFSIDLWNEIARANDYRTTFVEVTTVGELLDAVQTGKADVAITAISITAERTKLVQFSEPMFNGGLQIAVPAARTHETGGIWVTLRSPAVLAGRFFSMIFMLFGVLLVATFTATFTASLTVHDLQTDIQGVSDLQGRKVVTVKGTTAASYLSGHQIAAQEVGSVGEMIEQLDSGDLDARCTTRPSSPTRPGNRTSHASTWSARRSPASTTASPRPSHVAPLHFRRALVAEAHDEALDRGDLAFGELHSRHGHSRLDAIAQ